MKEIKAGRQLNTGSSLVETGVFLLILNVLIAVHGWQMILNHFQVAGDGLLVEQAWIRHMQMPVFRPEELESYYVFFLRFLFLFFGNRQAIVLIANIVLQLLGIFLFYRGCRRLTNGPVSLVVAVILAAVSIVDFSVVADDPRHLVWFIGSFLFWLLSLIKPIYKRIAAAGTKKQPVSNNTPVSHPPVVPVTEAVPRQEKQEIREIAYIPNPLPLPKKHVKKEMDYAFEPEKEQMHYDLNNYRVEDDYDIMFS